MLNLWWTAGGRWLLLAACVILYLFVFVFFFVFFYQKVSNRCRH
jgi:hypothetical protein